MTTDVQERLALPTAQPRRLRGFRAWIVFFAAVVLAALAIGIIAAAFGNAVKALDGANSADAAAQSALQTADAQVQAAQTAKASAEAAIVDRRQAIVDDLQSQPRTTTFSMNDSSPAFAEVRAMEDSLRTNETAALDAANLAQADAATEAAAARGDVAEAQKTLEADTQPLWIESIASGAVLLALLIVAIVLSRRRALR